MQTPFLPIWGEIKSIDLLQVTFQKHDTASCAQVPHPAKSIQSTEKREPDQHHPSDSATARTHSASPTLGHSAPFSQHQNLDSASHTVLMQSKLTQSQQETHPCERQCHRPLCCVPPDGESLPELPSPTSATSDHSYKNKAFVQLNVFFHIPDLSR